MESKRYAIESVWDFLKVPEDRLDLCLREFRIALEMGRLSAILVDAVAEEMFGPDHVRTVPNAFVWIDDDEQNFTINILSPEPVSPSSAREQR